MTRFEIEYIDHVAIRVSEMEVSANWYEKVLGLIRYQLPQWGDIPIFLLSGKAGVALFPANLDHPKLPLDSKNSKIDHFAFNVTPANFENAKRRYEELGIVYDFQDHHYFHSIYIEDPDGHIIELTKLVVDAEKFYK